MSGGDVKVIGLTMGTYVIEDIMMDVPMGVTVTIPGARAYASKDLWRGISQKRLFQLHPGSSVPAVVQRPPDNVEVDALRGQIRSLVEDNLRLREALATKVPAPAPQPPPPPPKLDESKLDDILALLRSGLAGTAVSGRAEASSNGAVSGDVPNFIPSQIKPENVEVKISTTPEERSGEGVQGAAEALRKFRKGSG